MRINFFRKKKVYKPYMVYYLSKTFNIDPDIKRDYTIEFRPGVRNTKNRIFLHEGNFFFTADVLTHDVIEKVKKAIADKINKTDPSSGDITIKGLWPLENN